jgi:hypothetical protein
MQHKFRCDRNETPRVIRSEPAIVGIQTNCEDAMGFGRLIGRLKGKRPDRITTHSKSAG